MSGPEIALAASARDWPERLHRFLLDHGGGRVRARVMGSRQATEEHYQVLFIDDVCSFLTPRLVRSLREQGKEVIGVFSPADGPDAKRHLLECGVTDVIEEDASPDELLAAANATLVHRQPPASRPVRPTYALRIGVIGVSGGVGCTEVAIALSSRLAGRRPTLLVDLDPVAPALVQRLDLPVHPNLLTAVDLAHQSPGELPRAIHRLGDLDVIGGVAGAAGPAVAPVEVDGLLEETARLGYDIQVGDLGSAGSRPVDELRFRILVLVSTGTPVGITRLVRSIEGLWRRREADELVAVVNRVGAGATRRLEIRAELTRLMPDVPVLLLPEDRRLERAAWDGSHVGRGPFLKAIERLAVLLDGVVA